MEKRRIIDDSRVSWTLKLNFVNQFIRVSELEYIDRSVISMQWFSMLFSFRRRKQWWQPQISIVSPAIQMSSCSKYSIYLEAVYILQVNYTKTLLSGTSGILIGWLIRLLSFLSKWCHLVSISICANKYLRKITRKSLTGKNCKLSDCLPALKW